MHVDDWLDTPDVGQNANLAYAKFVLDYKRLPAWKQIAYAEWMAKFKLFCTHKGERYRCTGASRLGDVWLARDFNRDAGYDFRVDVLDCKEWAPKP
jgi:hypothetical protein